MERFKSRGTQLTDVSVSQLATARRFGAIAMPPDQFLKVGIARNVRSGILPLNALRHPATEDVSGWYIWAGEELSQDPDFFMPLHVDHVDEWCPEILPYLALPPGWRVLLAPGYEDVWYDGSLLMV